MRSTRRARLGRAAWINIVAERIAALDPAGAPSVVLSPVNTGHNVTAFTEPIRPESASSRRLIFSPEMILLLGGFGVLAA